MTTIGVLMTVLGMVGITVGLIARDEEADLGRTRFTVGGVCLALGVAALVVQHPSDLPGFTALPGLALLLSSALVFRHIQADDDARHLNPARHPQLQRALHSRLQMDRAPRRPPVA